MPPPATTHFPDPSTKKLPRVFYIHHLLVAFHFLLTLLQAGFCTPQQSTKAALLRVTSGFRLATSNGGLQCEPTQPPVAFDGDNSLLLGIISSHVFSCPTSGHPSPLPMWLLLKVQVPSAQPLVLHLHSLPLEILSSHMA